MKVVAWEILPLKDCLSRFRAGHLQSASKQEPLQILGRTIDFSQLEEQKGDVEPTLFAFYDTREPEALFHVVTMESAWAGSRDHNPCPAG